MDFGSRSELTEWPPDADLKVLCIGDVQGRSFECWVKVIHFSGGYGMSLEIWPRPGGWVIAGQPRDWHTHP